MAEPMLVPLSNIQPNPWQPRQSEDGAAIADLAASILRDGLLQVPTGRKCSDGTIQLAFGHSRLAAFRLLADQGKLDAFPDSKEVPCMPVIIRELSDRQMFEQATIENVKRRQLNPVELAAALERYMREFRATSAEAGELFGLNEATVRGKVRLLDLPRPAQEQLAAGRISEGAARQLLSLQKVAPEKSVVKAAEAIAKGENKVLPDDVIEGALEKLTSAVEMWDREGEPRAHRFNKNSWKLSMKNFPNGLLPEITQKDIADVADPDLKLADKLEKAYAAQPTIPDALRAALTGEALEKALHLLNPPACVACPYYTRVRGSHFCGMVTCHRRKSVAWGLLRMNQASKDLKIRPYDQKDGKFERLDSWNTRDRELWNKRHEGLRLVLRPDANGRQWGQYSGDEFYEVVATGTALKYKPEGGRGSGKKFTESELAEQRRKRIGKKWHKTIVWEFSVLGRELFKDLPLRALDLIDNWHFLGINDRPPKESEPQGKVTDDLKADYLRRQLVWSMVDSKHFASSYSPPTDMLRFAKQLEGLAAEWGMKMPPSVRRLAAEADAEIKAVSTATKKAKKA